MVKVGFIVEGDSEMVFMKRNAAFMEFLSTVNIEISALVDGKGGQLLNPRLLNGLKAICKDAGSEIIIILTDLDEELSFDDKKSKIDSGDITAIVIAKRSFEAWFLADTDAIRNVIGKSDYYCEFPEDIITPFEEIKGLAKLFNNGTGVGSKPFLAGKMNNQGFNITNAAQHPNCPSALYFVNKLKELAN